MKLLLFAPLITVDKDLEGSFGAFPPSWIGLYCCYA